MNISSSSSLLTPPSVFRCFVCLSTVAYLSFLRIAKIMAATRIHTAGNVSIIIRNCLAEFSVFCSVFCSVSSSGIGSSVKPIFSPSEIASTLSSTVWSPIFSDSPSVKKIIPCLVDLHTENILFFLIIHCILISLHILRFYCFR